MTPTTPAKLPLYEWCIITLFCAILLVLATLAFGRQEHTVPAAPPSPPPAGMQIKVEGEVANPGIYELPLTGTLKELLAQAQPLPNADLSQLNWRRRLRDGQTIRIPVRKPITITIAGAVVEPGPMEILSGTRYQELADQLQVLPEADMTVLRKRRRIIQEGDVVTIPVKKKKGEKSIKSKEKNKKKSK